MKKIFTVLFGAYLLTGCATIVGDDTQLVQVNSDPAGADYQIKDDAGRVVAQGKTPQGVTLENLMGVILVKRTIR